MKWKFCFAIVHGLVLLISRNEETTTAVKIGKVVARIFARIFLMIFPLKPKIHKPLIPLTYKKYVSYGMIHYTVFFFCVRNVGYKS